MENEIYKPLTTSPKSSMWDKCKREKRKKGLKATLSNGVAITITLIACLVLCNQSCNVIKMVVVIPLPRLVTIEECNQDCIVITFTSIYANTIT